LAAKADGLLWADRSAEASFSGEHDMMKLFLLVAGVFLFPVALSYGVDPAASLPKFMNFTVEGTMRPTSSGLLWASISAW
jgi:hypothetical protein